MGRFNVPIVMVAGALVGCALLAACGRKSPVATDSTPEAPSSLDAVTPSREPSAPSTAADPADAGRTIAEAEKLLRGGSYDEAAARLLKMRISGTQFSAKDAAAYRDALQVAYSRALEAAAKGDPKGRAALEMIRAARPR
jgi:hypothetical protein